MDVLENSILNFVPLEHFFRLNVSSDVNFFIFFDASKELGEAKIN